MLDPNAKKKGFALKNLNPKLRKKIADDKVKRERELLRRKMAASIDFIGEGDVNFENRDKKKTIWTSIIELFSAILEFMKPFKSDINKIKSNYDISISLFFEII